MQTTGNLGLKKPEGTDYVDIADLNGNMDKLDTEVVKLASPTESGRMSAADKAKLNGVAAGANNYVHPNHTGDVTSNGDGVTAIAPGVIVNADVNAAAGIDASKIGTGIVSNAEYGYLDGVTSGIQAQLNARPLLTTTPQQTTGDITYYVRTDGNDSNNGLANTAGGAFKTIAKAISMVPKVINHTATINVAAGTYDESIDASNFTGRLTLMAGDTAFGKTNVKSISFSFCTGRLEANGFTATSATITAFMALYSQQVIFTSCYSSVASTSYNGAEYTFSSGRIEGGNISNRANAIVASWCSMVYVNGTSGSGNAGYGVLAIRSSYIGVETSVYPTGVVSQWASSGSTVVSNGGSGVLNPWGDNTWSQRSRVEAGPNGVQTITPATFTKVSFATEHQDVLGEYNPATSSFIANSLGTYLFSVQVGVTGGIEGTVRGIVEIWVNGGVGKVRIFDSTMGAGTDFSAAGATAISLGAGDYAEVYIWLSTAKNLTTTTSYNFVRVIRVA